jgi:tetratricopeptide (TPR) repeat protein
MPSSALPVAPGSTETCSASPEPGRPSGPRGGRTLLVVALLAAIYCGYSPALDGELQFDDLHSIIANAAIRDLAHFAKTRLGDVVGTGRALTELTFALNYWANGLSVRPYHLVNVGFHLATVLAVLALTLLILRRVRWRDPFATAFIVAALFGLHPIQSQAVAYVCQRAEVLAALFYVLALLLVLESETMHRVLAALAAYAGAFACVLLGFAAKPTLSSFPAALLLCSWAFPAIRRGFAQGAAGWTRLLVSLPFWALTAFSSARLLAGVSGTGHAGFDLPTITPGRYLLTESRVVLTYLRLLAWPAGQNLDWDFALSASPFEPRTLGALLAIAGLLLAAAWLWRWSAVETRDPELRAVARLAAFGILWFFILLAPTSSVVPVADVLEEHRVYLASWGIFLPAVAAAVLVQRRLAPRKTSVWAGAAVALALCAALAVSLYQRAAVWETGVSLWTDVVSKSPGKARGHMNLGYALTPTAPERAVSEYRRALQLADMTIRRAELLQDLAGALLNLRRYGEAIAILEELAARAPESAELGTNIAIAYLESGRLDEAYAAVLRVATRWPLYAPARHTLGQLALLRRDYRSAALQFEWALRLDPDSTESLISLAAARERLGDRAAACKAWSRYAASSAPNAGEKASAMKTALGCDDR